MREIKFRAWHDGGKYPNEACMLFAGDDYGTTHSLDCCKYLMEGQPVTLMQFTGLYDKNGAEIFEGDLLDFDEGVWGGAFKPEVVTMDKIIGDWGLCGTPDDIESYRSVIGNIHEHPHLIED